MEFEDGTTTTEGGEIREPIKKDDVEFILVFGHSILLGRKYCQKIRNYSNYTDMLPILFMYFPKLDRDVLKKAITGLENIDQFKPNF
jgi:hypothetical protein